jgi:Xaa-Pro aminopeptidase
MNPAIIEEIRTAIRQEGLDGWLFCNFRHRDPLADEILGVNPGATNSRLWFYAVPASGGDSDDCVSGEALGILHAVEPDSLDAVLPGKRVFYRSREELLTWLAPLAGKRWGCHFSKSITAISYLDAGTALLLEEAGLCLVPAEGLLQRFKGLLSPAGIAAHERAAGHLYEIVDLVWEETRRRFASGAALYEGDIRRLILEEFARRNLVTDHPPIVAAGKNSCNPHYDLSTPTGDRIAENDVVQLDLWAKESGPGGIYADISWVGFYGQQASAGIEQAFANLVQSREGALRFIQEALSAGRRPAGADVDQRTREILTGFGYAGALRHRTGHGIDTLLHGSGVNMDSVEFPDSRRLLDGSCFSLEPGVYFTDFGMRTEIDVYIKDGAPVISGKDRQFALLYC